MGLTGFLVIANDNYSVVFLQTEYQQWNASERVRPVKKEQYTPADAPFEGQPTYRRDYIKHSGTVMTRSLKPVDLGYSSNAPIDDFTEYRNQYTAKKMDSCLARKLLHANDPAEHGFELHEKDDRGHVWYRPEAGVGTTRG